jgi:predicted DNA-binding transcriptional regulator AlpA
VNFIGGLPGLMRRGIRWSKQHLGRLERLEEFPRRVKVGFNTADWVEEEIDDWIAGKIRARDAAAE